ncbi:MAG TPA: DUF6776 family protein [Rhodanobacteraceae bacterium]|nr:DUF6776 family protein [Rhodanobacteraceae bacterium]
MASPESPRFIVRKHDPAAHRRRLAGTVAGLCALALLVGAFGFALGRFSAPPARTLVAPQPLPAPVASANQALAQQVATLKQSEKVSRIAAAKLRETLAEREQEITGLRADVAFYSRLVGSGERAAGVAVHGVDVAPIAGSHAYTVTVTLTESAHRGRDNSGRVRLAVEGVQDGKLSVLQGTELGGRNSDDGLAYAFKYFQQLHTTVVLPAGFVANRLRVTVQPKGASDVQRTIAWADALDSRVASATATTTESSHVP